MKRSALPLLIGIDGGGTGCRLALCTLEGERLATASAGPANFSSDAAGALQNLRQCLVSLGLSEDRLQSAVAHIGLAGVLTEEDAQSVAQAFPMARCVVSDDRQTSVEGGLAEAQGILASLGTGSFVAVKSAEGTRYFGGWGLQLGDQASGAWLGREALRQAVMAQDGLRPASPLTDALLAKAGPKARQIVDFARKATAADYASFAPFVIKAAAAGDGIALNLMQRGAAYLVTCFERAATDPADPIVLSGSIGPHFAPYLAEFAHRLRPPKGTALDGALRLAKRAYEAGKTA
jgi:glucosamine kinase